MAIPLYQEHEAPNAPPHGAHFGLWYTRFFNRYTDNWTLDDSAKQGWVKTVANQLCGNEAAIKQHSLRLLKLVKALKGDFVICESNWHFVTGLGLPHPVENGFTWHQTLGVPFLAGSAIKGVLRAWVECWDEADREQRLKAWFGDQDETGKLVFFDAIPIAPVRLMLDIMTPHCGKWYEKGQDINGYDMNAVLGHPERLPADWHDPVPVPFLVAKQAKFLVAVAARNANKADGMVPIALESLVAALQWLGVGAKTGAGYGHLVRDEKAEQSLREDLSKKPKASVPPSPSLPGFMADVTEKFPGQADYISLLKALEEGQWKDKPEQEKAVAEFVKKRLVDEKKWRETSAKKNPKKDINFQRTLRVLKFLS